MALASHVPTSGPLLELTVLVTALPLSCCSEKNRLTIHASSTLKTSIILCIYLSINTPIQSYTYSSIHLSTPLPIHLSTYIHNQSIHPSTCPSAVQTAIQPSHHPSVCKLIQSSIYPSTHPSTHSPIYLSIPPVNQLYDCFIQPSFSEVLLCFIHCPKC